MNAPRPCFIGNSHLASLKLAADRDRALIPGGGKAAWFAGSSTSLEALRLDQDRWLVPRSRQLRQQMRAVSGGADRIDLTGHDLFVIVGAVFDYPTMLRFFRFHCLPGDVARGRQAGRSVASESLFRAFLAQMASERPGERIAAQIRAVNPGARVAILPAPYPAETLLDHPRLANGLCALKGSEFFAELADLHLAGARRGAAAAGAILVPQGPETLSAPGFTRTALNRDAVGLAPANRAEPGGWLDEKTRYDPWHMNAEFGRLRLLDLARALQAPLAASA